MSLNINLQTKVKDHKKKEKEKKNTGLAADLIYGELTNPWNETLWGFMYSFYHWTYYSECSGIPSICQSCDEGPHGYDIKSIWRTNELKITPKKWKVRKKNLCCKCECWRKVLKWFLSYKFKLWLSLCPAVLFFYEAALTFPQTGSWLFPHICCELTVGSQGDED